MDIQLQMNGLSKLQGGKTEKNAYTKKKHNCKKRSNQQEKHFYYEKKNPQPKRTQIRKKKMNLSRCSLRIGTNALLKLDVGCSKYCETARCDNFVMTHFKPFDTFAATEFNSKTSLAVCT